MLLVLLSDSHLFKIYSSSTGLEHSLVLDSHSHLLVLSLICNIIYIINSTNKITINSCINKITCY